MNTDPGEQPTRVRNRTSLWLATCRLVLAAFAIAGAVAMVFVAANETARRVTGLVSTIVVAGPIHVIGPVDGAAPSRHRRPSLGARPMVRSPSSLRRSTSCSRATSCRQSSTRTGIDRRTSDVARDLVVLALVPRQEFPRVRCSPRDRRTRRSDHSCAATATWPCRARCTRWGP